MAYSSVEGYPEVQGDRMVMGSCTLKLETAGPDPGDSMV